MVYAARKDAEKAAARELQKLNLWGAHRDISPIEALAEELGRTAGRVSAIEQRLAQVPDDAQDTPRARGLAAELSQERGQFQRVAEAAARAGVPERAADLSTEQGLQIATLLRRTLDDLELTAAQSAALPALMRWHFADTSDPGQAGARPPRPSQLPAGAYVDVPAEIQRHIEAQTGDPSRPGAAPALPARPEPEPDHGRLIQLRAVVARSDNEQER